MLREVNSSLATRTAEIKARLEQLKVFFVTIRHMIETED